LHETSCGQFLTRLWLGLALWESFKNSVDERAILDPDLFTRFGKAFDVRFNTRGEAAPTYLLRKDKSQWAPSA
jgi:hypothetical protein